MQAHITDNRTETVDTILADPTARDWQTAAPEAVGTVRFAVVGTGWFTRHVSIPGIAASDYCDVAVVVAESATEAEAVAADVGGDTRGLATDAFLAGDFVEAYDAVYIATPNAFHLTYTEAAARRGKDVLCEKPMERDSERAERMVAVCEDAGVELGVAYRMQTEPAVRRARELLHHGLIGDPVHVHGSMAQRLLQEVNPNPDQWRLDAELAGGGALFDLGVYPLNTARFLLDADPVAVTGRARGDGAFEAVDESVRFTVEFPDEVYATCFASQNAHQSSSLSVVGTEGRLTIEPAFFPEHPRVLHLSCDEREVAIEVDPVDQFREEFDHFAHQLRTDEGLPADGAHGLVDMYTMEAVYESDERGEWVDL